MVDEATGESFATPEVQPPDAEHIDTAIADAVFGPQDESSFASNGGSIFRPDASHSTDALAKKEAIAINTGTRRSRREKARTWPSSKIPGPYQPGYIDCFLDGGCVPRCKHCDIYVPYDFA